MELCAKGLIYKKDLDRPAERRALDEDEAAAIKRMFQEG